MNIKVDADKLRIAFLGLREFFDYFYISGFQSFFRRITSEMLFNGMRVDYILYDSGKSEEIEPEPNLRLRYFQDFEDAILAMSSSNYDHIITIRLSRRDRFKVAFFRKKYLGPAKCHYMSLVWPDSWIKRNLIFIEAKLVSGNGKIISISPRLYQSLNRWAKNVEFIFPPVTKSYFLKPEEKPKNDKIKITFLGVIYPDKGIDEVIHIFTALKEDQKFELSIYAIYEPRNKESLELRNWLKNQNIIKYVEVDRYNYTPEVEDIVRKVLKETDIFIQLYRTLGATVDVPLLLLEAMASLCAVITTPIGNIADIYGESKFLIDTKYSISQIVSFLKNISFEEIKRERERIFEQNKKFEFEASKVAQQFIRILTDNQ